MLSFNKEARPTVGTRSSADTKQRIAACSGGGVIRSPPAPVTSSMTGDCQNQEDHQQYPEQIAHEVAATEQQEQDQEQQDQ
jgi:hypothetical protein